MSEAVGIQTAPSTPPWTLINMVTQSTENKVTRSGRSSDSSDSKKKPRNTNSVIKKKLNLESPGHRTPDGKGIRSPMDGKLPSRETRSTSKIEGDKKDVVLHSTFASTPTENPSLLQVSIFNRTGISPGVSPLAIPLSDTEAESSEQSSDNNTSQNRPKKAKCPCMATSGGQSWLLTCSRCEQVWHSGCANLKGAEFMDQKLIDAILVSWECPWCYSCPFKCPKTHKSAKLTTTLDSISRANEVSAAVIESLEGMLKTRFDEATKPTNDLIDNIQEQLKSLSDQIKSLQNAPPQPPPSAPPLSHGHPPFLRHAPPPPPKLPRVEVEETTLKHSQKCIENIIEDFITSEEEGKLMDLLENQNFTKEGKRATIQYGQHYRYMGSKTQPQPMPDLIKNIMTRLNSQFAKSHSQKQFHYELNSCLINRYANGSETLPEHSDNEGDINRQSSIFTVSLGSSRTVHFRDISSNETTEVMCHGRSMYHMTRASQEFFKHSIKQEESGDEGVRYSLTFRSVHWSNFNSTVLVGDSNFGPIHFGSGRGKMGQATPGVRLWAATVEDIDPLSCVGYRNVVVMDGTNNLKLDCMNENGVVELYKKYKTKIAQIRKYNPRCKLMVCPVLPTKSHKINHKINLFNRYLFSDLSQSNLKVIVIDSFMPFLDKGSNLLKSSLAKPDANDILHIGGRGVGTLVKLIKNCIFTSRDYNRLVGSRLYSNTTRGGPPDPV